MTELVTLGKHVIPSGVGDCQGSYLKKAPRDPSIPLRFG